MTRSTLPSFCLPIFVALGACAEPDTDATPPATGYRVALVVEQEGDELELRLLDVDPAGNVREVALVLEHDDSEFDDVEAAVSPDGRWLGVDRSRSSDGLPYALFDLDDLHDADRLEGETLRLQRDGAGGRPTFSADSTVLALPGEDGAHVVSMVDSDHTSTGPLDLEGEDVREIFARPGSAELLFGTEDALWWHRGNPDDARVRDLVRPFHSNKSPFLDAATFYYQTHDTWAFAEVVDGVVANVEDIEIPDDDGEIVLCDELEPHANGGRVGGACEAGDEYYWVDASDVESPWRFHDRVATIEDVALAAGGRYLVYVAREDGEGRVLHAADLAAHGEPIELDAIDEVDTIVTCFDHTYVLAGFDFYRIDALGGEAPALVETSGITGLGEHSWHCMPDEHAAVLVTNSGVYLLRATEPDLLHEVARIESDNSYFRPVGAGDATRLVYRELTCEDVEICDVQLMELSTTTGETRRLVDADVRDAYLITR